MNIAFRDQDEINAFGLAGYLVIRTEGDVYHGGLLVLDARGEPVYFVTNQVQVVNRFLWREEDITLGAWRRLIESLVAACPTKPALLLCETAIPERLAQDNGAVMPLMVSVVHGERIAIVWCPEKPPEGSPAFTLWERLSSRGLLHEPFVRTANGLAECRRKNDQRPGATSPAGEANP